MMDDAITPPLRTLIIPSWVPSKQSPMNGKFVREQAKCLARRFDVTLLTPRFVGISEFLKMRPGPEWIEREDGELRVCEVRKWKIPTVRRFLPFFSGPDHVFVYYQKFASAIRRGFLAHVKHRGLPDIIHAHVVAPAGWIAVELGKEFGVPVVLTEHSEPFAGMHLATPRLRAMARDVILNVDQVIAVSCTLRDNIQAFCPDVPIDVVGNVIDTEFFTPSPKAKTATGVVRFFFLGVLIERKGVQHLIRAAQALQMRGFSNFEIRLGGNGPYRETLQHLAATLGVEDRCRFLGMLTRAEVLDEMRACDVFVLPSLGETFGIVVGEAMACGKPVLSTRCGGPEEIVTPDTGILVQPGDSEQLADGMAGFLAGQFCFQTDRIRQSIVGRFGETAFLEKTEAVYGKLVKHAKPVRLGKAG